MILLACGYKGKYDDEPRIREDLSMLFSAEAQSKTFNVVMAGGKPYNGRIAWHIASLYCRQGSDEFGTNRVDTLDNGDMIIASDWARLRVPKEKNWVEVTVTENNTPHTRSARLATKSHGVVVLLELLITQDHKK